MIKILVNIKLLCVQILFWPSLLVLLLITYGCDKLDLERVMDATTDSVKINGTTVQVYGTVLDLGHGKILNHGHCWATHPNPDILDFNSDLGTIEGTAGFYSFLSSIKPGEMHYVRSYIFDGNQYKYGKEVSFEVTANDLLFKIDSTRKLDEATIKVSSSTFGIGSVNFSNHGHCWSQSELPTVENSKTTFGEYVHDTVFSSVLHNLVMGRYYIRAYLNSDGKVFYSDTYIYESQISVNTKILSLNGNNSITAQGEIISLGIHPIIQYGHCWSNLTSTPTFNSNKTTLGQILYPGQYSSVISDLIAGQKYYVRAYATDGINVYYGEVMSIIVN
jgi:hypothetical protein